MAMSHNTKWSFEFKSKLHKACYCLKNIYTERKKDFGKLLKINQLLPPEEEVLCVALFE